MHLIKLWGGILRNLSLKGGVSGSLRSILCLVALVWPVSCFSNEKMLWYSFKRLRAFSACSLGHASRSSGPVSQKATPASQLL